MLRGHAICRINYADSHQVVYRSLDVQTVGPRKGLQRNEIRYVGSAPASGVCMRMWLEHMAAPSLHRAPGLRRATEKDATEIAGEKRLLLRLAVPCCCPKPRCQDGQSRLRNSEGRLEDLASHNTGGETSASGCCFWTGTAGPT